MCSLGVSGSGQAGRLEYPRTGAAEGWELPCGCWDPNWGSLEGRHVLVSAEPCLSTCAQQLFITTSEGPIAELPSVYVSDVHGGSAEQDASQLPCATYEKQLGQGALSRTIKANGKIEGGAPHQKREAGFSRPLPSLN